MRDIGRVAMTVLDVLALAIFGGFVLYLVQAASLDWFMAGLLGLALGWLLGRGHWIYRAWRGDKLKARLEKEREDQRQRELFSRS